QLAAAGFTPDEYQLGWQLIHASSGFKPLAPAPTAPARSPAFVAMQEIDAWDEDGIRRVRAALERLHPEQAAFVFKDGLAASVGPAAVVGVATLLSRLGELENGADRKATRKADNAALATLTARGITKAERDRLQALVAAAQTVDAPAEPGSAIEPAEKQQALLKMYAWYKDWSNTAHSVIKKRAHLITLGLAKRRATKKSEEDKK
ncbi:MAG: hypothetical protein ACMG6S_20305, partial [Byssovorax sp.]